MSIHFHSWTPARVVIDEAPSLLGPYPAEISYHRWKGFVIPRFSAETVNQIVQDTAGWEASVHWEEDVAVTRVEQCDGDPWIEHSHPDADGRYCVGAATWVWETPSSITEDEAGRRIHNLISSSTPTPELLAEVPAILADAGLIVSRVNPAANDRTCLHFAPGPVDPATAARRIHHIHHGRARDWDLLRRIAAVAENTDLSTPPANHS
ncbi:hypothetical protein [Streptomyces albipurpureus]|uniref:DUF317 domain-containing protein n=1 Tax=Streptomyces albipurpureus TaxID=2897419 RepID=A0ABT0UJK4_9ACTN|nr:hypothetical protein [Streptomyces sp. CWNU-1]MCM2388813.1 hypothetical protein [Streptomyces sp. CWNU-1]